LLVTHEPPCISLYQPTHRQHPENQQDPIDSPEVDDLIDDVMEAVLRTGGEVIVVPAERMPTDTGLAATFRTKKSVSRDT